MTAMELIDQLTSLVAQHGDLTVLDDRDNTIHSVEFIDDDGKYFVVEFQSFFT